MLYYVKGQETTRILFISRPIHVDHLLIFYILY